MLATGPDVDPVREPVQGERGARRLDDLGRDLRHAARGLRRSPGVAASVALMLALSLGANTAMFGIVHGVLLRPLPYPNADAIVRIGESLGSVGGSDMWLSNRSMPLLEESAESFEQLAGYLEVSARSASLDGATLSGARVTPSLFPLLGSTPRLGRLFTEAEGREGANPVVLLGHGVWTTRFGSAAASSAPSSTSTASRTPSSAFSPTGSTSRSRPASSGRRWSFHRSHRRAWTTRRNRAWS